MDTDASILKSKLEEAELGLSDAKKELASMLLQKENLELNMQTTMSPGIQNAQAIETDEKYDLGDFQT